MRFEKVLQSAEREDGVALWMLGQDGKKYDLELAGGCIAAVVTALLSGYSKLGYDGSRDQQLPTATGVTLAVSDTGQTTLVFLFEGGGELPLVLESRALGELLDQAEVSRSAPGPLH